MNYVSHTMVFQVFDGVSPSVGGAILKAVGCSSDAQESSSAAWSIISPMQSLVASLTSKLGQVSSMPFRMPASHIDP